MLTIYVYIIASSLVTSLLSLSGALVLVISPKFLNRVISFLVSLSAGTLLGDAFFHLLPEATAKNNSLALWAMVISGMLLFFVLEKIIHWRHCHHLPSGNHPHPVGIMNIVGGGLHNFIDGLVIGASYLISIPVGIATTLAVISHEIPQELGDFGTLIYAGYKPRKALWLNLLSGLVALLGALTVIVVGVHLGNFVDYVIPLTAGGFLYIASSDLIPEMKKESLLSDTLKQLFGILLGLGIMIVLRIVME